MIETLQAVTRTGVIGTVVLDGQNLVPSTPALQDIIDSWLKRKGSAQAAFTAMDGWFNGYLAFTRPGAAAEHTAALARPYERTEHGRQEHVRGYISPAKWKTGQQEWVSRGEAAWAVRGEAARAAHEAAEPLTGDAVHAAAGTPDLDNAEAQALWLYTSDTKYSSVINDGLQRGEEPGAEVRGLDSAIAKAPPLPRAAVVYRGGHWDASLKPGDVLEEKGFTSTTTRQAAAEPVFAMFPAERRVQLAQVTIPAGMRVLSAANQGSRLDQNAGEAEVILPRGTRFRVTGYSTAVLRYSIGTRMHPQQQAQMILLEAELPAVESHRLQSEKNTGAHAPSPESLAAARQMVQADGATPEQHEAIALTLAENLDLVPARMRDAMARTWKVRLSPQADVNADPDVLGATWWWGDGWEIRIAQQVLTPVADREVAEMEGDGRFVKTEGSDLGKALRHVVTHEFGHAVFEQALISAGETVRMDDGMGTTPAGQMVEERVVNRLLEDLSGGTVDAMSLDQSRALNALSVYGSTSPEEGMAESWTGYALHGHGANGSARVQTAGRGFLQEVKQEFAAADRRSAAGVHLTVPGVVPYHGCSGFPGTREAFDRRFGAPEAKAAAARAWQVRPDVSLAAVQPYERTERGRQQRVRGYDRQRGWISPAKWRAGQREWVARGEAAANSDRLTDEAFAARQRHVEHAAGQAAKAGLETGSTPEQVAAVHESILDEVMRKAQDVPREGKAIVTGGMPGAGKSSSLDRLADMSQYYAISPDDFKEALAARGMIPQVKDLSSMEASSLVGQEAAELAVEARRRLLKQRTNIVRDGTMLDPAELQNLVRELHRHGYTVHGVFVHVSVETAVERASGRYRGQLEAWRAGMKETGGRNVASNEMKRTYTVPGTGIALPELSFLRQRHLFDRWDEFDNSGNGPPRLISSGGKPGHVGLARVSGYQRRSPRGRLEHVPGYVTQRPAAVPDEHGWIPPADWLKGQRTWVARGEAIWEQNEWKRHARTFHAAPDADLRPASALRPGDRILLPSHTGNQEHIVREIERKLSDVQVAHTPAVSSWEPPADTGMSWESGRMRLADLTAASHIRPDMLAGRAYSQEDLAADIRQHGVQKPVSVYHMPDYVLVVGNGNHRVDAAIDAGAADIPVVVQHAVGTNPRDVPILDRKPATYAEWREADQRPGAVTVTAMEPARLVPVVGPAPPRPPDVLELFHGTSKAKTAALIRANGLTSAEYGNEYYSTLTYSKDEAGYFAGRHGAVVTVRIPRAVAGEYLNTVTGNITGLKKPIPAEMIAGADYINPADAVAAASAAAGPGEIKPLPQGTPTARPVLYPDQRRMLEAAVNNVRHPGTTADALDRIADNQPLSAEQLTALGISTRLEARTAATARARALIRIADQLDAARYEIAAAQGTQAEAEKAYVAGQIGRLPAGSKVTKTTAGDLAVRDVIAWRDFDGTMSTGTVTGISTQRHGRLVETTITSSDGSVLTHLFSARTVIYQLPDLPPDKPLPPPGTSTREYVTAGNLRIGDVLEGIWGGGPATVTSIKRTGFLSVSVGLRRADGGEWETEVGGNPPPGIVGIRSSRGPASQNQPWDMTVPVETPEPVRPGQVRPGDMIRISGYPMAGGDVTGTVTSTERVVGEQRGHPGTQLGVLEQDLKGWRVTTYSFFGGTQDASITRLVPAAANPLARFADAAAQRREAIASSLWFTFGRMYKEMLDGIASVALTAAQSVSYDAVPEAIRGMTIEPLLIRVAYLRASAAGQMVPGGIDGRTDLVTEASASLIPLTEQIAEMARQQVLAAVANMPADARAPDSVVYTIEALQETSDPPLPDQAVRALAAAAQQMAESVTGPAQRGGPPEVPHERPHGASVAERIAPYRAALPANPADLGKTYVNRSLFEAPSLESLRQGIVPALRTAQAWVADKAADGGPGLVAMKQNDIIRTAGIILHAEVMARGASATGETPDQVRAHEDALQLEIGRMRAEEYSNWDRASAAGNKARDEFVRQQGFQSWADLALRLDFNGRIAGYPEIAANAAAAYNQAYQAVRKKDEGLQQRRKAAQQELADYKKAVASARRDAVISVLSEARGEPFGGVKLSYTAARGAAAEKSVLVKALRWAEGNYPASWLSAAADHVKGNWQGYFVAPKARGDYDDGARRINLSKDDEEKVPGAGLHGRVATHEMGHVMEAAVPGLSAMENAELWRRTAPGTVGSRQQEQLRRMDGYVNEYARGDQFPLPYSGKEYTPDDTFHELFTTGAESLLAGSSYLDTAFEQWMLGVLALAGPSPLKYTGAAEPAARSAEMGDRLAVASAPKPVIMVTAGGYKVQTVSTVDRGQYFLVTGPTGLEVPLDPWQPRNSPEIRTVGQLKEVLQRAGEDFATLHEQLPAGEPLGAPAAAYAPSQRQQAWREAGNPELFQRGVQVAPVLQPVFGPVLAMLSPRAAHLLDGKLTVRQAPNMVLEGDIVGAQYHDDTASLDFNPAAFGNPQYAAMHEVGHALDHRLGWVSEDPRWAALLGSLARSGDITVKDYLKLQPRSGPQLQASDVARSQHETWAEFFAWHMMGNGGDTGQITHVSTAAARQLSAYFAQFGVKGSAAPQFESEKTALAAPLEGLPVCVLVVAPDGQVRSLSEAEIRQLAGMHEKDGS